MATIMSTPALEQGDAKNVLRRTTVEGDEKMTHYRLTMPEIVLVAGTRAMLGAGIGMLLADWLNPRARQVLGWTLLAVGALTTPPLAMEVFGRKERQLGEDRLEMANGIY
jgi:hypothetical protein